MSEARTVTVGGLALAAVLVLSGCSEGYGADSEKAVEKAPKPQETCPVMGGPVNKELYVDHEGRRIYVCCAGCVAAVKADPAKAIRKIEAKGETVARLCAKCGAVKGSEECCKLPKAHKHAAVCTKCGETKGSDECCVADAAKCGMNKGSEGCCRLPK